MTTHQITAADLNDLGTDQTNAIAAYLRSVKFTGLQYDTDTATLSAIGCDSPPPALKAWTALGVLEPTAPPPPATEPARRRGRRP